MISHSQHHPKIAFLSEKPRDIEKSRITSRDLGKITESDYPCQTSITLSGKKALIS